MGLGRFGRKTQPDQGLLLSIPTVYQANSWGVKHNLGRTCNNERVALFYEELGRRIREARASKALTQAELGLAIGLSRASVANIERGYQQISLHHLTLAAEVLGTDVQTLLPPAALAPQETNPGLALAGLTDAQQRSVLNVIEAAPSKSSS